MSQAARLRDFVAILENSRLPVSRAYLLEELEVSSATFKRDLDVLRDQMHAPIKWVPGEGISLYTTPAKFFPGKAEGNR